MMEDYEVAWIIEVSGNDFLDAATHVDDLYLQPCESGNWVYEVTNIKSGEKRLITVVNNSEE